jgi:hypothetical protein
MGTYHDACDCWNCRDISVIQNKLSAKGKYAMFCSLLYYDVTHKCNAVLVRGRSVHLRVAVKDTLIAVRNLARNVITDMVVT